MYAVAGAWCTVPLSATVAGAWCTVPLPATMAGAWCTVPLPATVAGAWCGSATACYRGILSHLWNIMRVLN